MPADLPDIPDIYAADADNDDVVDLLEIVKPGKITSSAVAAPKKEDDFSADLDALLGQQIADAEKTLNAAAPSPPVPFPDPTPVDHTVDPDETLNMPSMDDLNNLLASLGADTASAPQPPASPPRKTASFPDLDALPLAAQQQSPGAGAQGVSARETAVNVPLDLDFDLPLPQSVQPVTPPPPADNPRDIADTPQPPGEAAPEILLQEPETPPATENAQVPDLPVLEALFAENIPTPPPDLPDMETLFSRQIPAASPPPRSPAGTEAPPASQALPAAAREEPPDPLPESGDSSPEAPSPAAPFPEEVAAALTPPSPVLSVKVRKMTPEGAAAVPLAAIRKEPPAPVLAAETGETPAEDSAAASRYDEVDLNELDAILEDMLASAPPSGPPPAQESRDASAPPGGRFLPAAALPPLQEAVSRVDTGLADLRKVLLEKDALLEKQQSRLAEQAALIGELRASLASLHENMDKMAALSAAKVIREELASLLKDVPPAT
jgi:hypothetical protein